MGGGDGRGETVEPHSSHPRDLRAAPCPKSLAPKLTATGHWEWEASPSPIYSFLLTPKTAWPKKEKPYFTLDNSVPPSLSRTIKWGFPIPCVQNLHWKLLFPPSPNLKQFNQDLQWRSAMQLGIPDPIKFKVHTHVFADDLVSGAGCGLRDWINADKVKLRKFIPPPPHIQVPHVCIISASKQPWTVRVYIRVRGHLFQLHHN